MSKYSDHYTDVQGAVYGKACKSFVDRTFRLEEKGRPTTELSRMAEKAGTAERCGGASAYPAPLPTERPKVYLLWSNDCCVDLEGEDHRSSPLLELRRPGTSSVMPAPGAVIGCMGMTQALEALFCHHGCHRAGSSMT